MDNVTEAIRGFFIQACMGYVPGQMFWLNNPISQTLLQLFGPASTKGRTTFFNWLFKRVAGRKAEEQPKDKPRDMLDRYIAMKDPDGQPVRFTGVFIEAGNWLGADANTSAIGIAMVLGQLLTRPENYRRVQQEVDEAYASLEGKPLDYLTAEKLPFLQACVKEATRLCPSILWQLPREAPKERLTIAGHHIPPSATISMSPIAQNSGREVLGDDAEGWRPERYLGEKEYGERSRSRMCAW